MIDLVNSHAADKGEKSTGAKAKARDEQKAALELREASMKGIVKCQDLTDVSLFRGATLREKQGQRHRPNK